MTEWKANLQRITDLSVASLEFDRMYDEMSQRDVLLCRAGVTSSIPADYDGDVSKAEVIVVSNALLSRWKCTFREISFKSVIVDGAESYQSILRGTPLRSLKFDHLILIANAFSLDANEALRILNPKEWKANVPSDEQQRVLLAKHATRDV
jgi:hypothetical protein